MKKLLLLVLLNVACSALVFLAFKHLTPKPAPYQRQLTVKQVAEEVLQKDEPDFSLISPALPADELDQDIILDATIDSLKEGRQVYLAHASQSTTWNCVMYAFYVSRSPDHLVIYRVVRDTRKILYKCDWKHTGL